MLEKNRNFIKSTSEIKKRQERKSENFKKGDNEDKTFIITGDKVNERS